MMLSKFSERAFPKSLCSWSPNEAEFHICEVTGTDIGNEAVKRSYHGCTLRKACSFDLLPDTVRVFAVNDGNIPHIRVLSSQWAGQTS